MNFDKYIITIQDFPAPGIPFKDITPLLRNAKAFKLAITQFVQFAKTVNPTLIAAADARGFIFAPAIAMELGIGFVPFRKKGKLPRETLEYKYELEYDKNTLCIHKGDILPEDKVLIFDDVLATGGTALAMINLVHQSGAKVAALQFLIAFDGLCKYQEVLDHKIHTILHY